MPQTQPSFFIKLLAVVVAIVAFGVASQWFNINWGRLEQGMPATITVTGQADDSQANQVATFYAGVTVDDANREAAVEKVNTQMTKLISQIKAFGIPEADIKTENISVYEYTAPDVQPVELKAEVNQGSMPQVVPPSRGGGEKIWQASNNLTIALRDVSKATDLATLLTNAGATTVSGPNFTTDDTTAMDRQLLEKAMTDAREKADLLLTGTNQRVTRVINIYENEGYTPYPMFREAAMGVANDQTTVPVEPGSQTLYKSVTVVFEISR
jgi:hypothetical protein